MQLPLPDWLIIGSFLAASLLIGLLFSRRAAWVPVPQGFPPRGQPAPVERLSFPRISISRVRSAL